MPKVRPKASRHRTNPHSSKPQPPADRPFAPGYGIVGANEGKGLLSWAWVAKKMNHCRTFWLATIHASQLRPHVMPVWGVWLGDAFFFSTARKSRKGQNLAANPACTIANDDGAEAVIVEGVATELKDAPTVKRFARAYKKKYRIDPTSDPMSAGEPIFAVRPRAVFGFIEKSFPMSATRWKP